MGDERGLPQSRAQEFGRLHPRLTLLIASVVLAGLIVICVFQIRHGTYLGSGWLVAAVAGMAAAAAFGTAALISNLRHRPWVDGLGQAWIVVAGGSALSFTVPFPVGHYGSVQAFFDMVHAIGLGYAAVTWAALITLFAVLIIHPGSLPSRAELRQVPRLFPPRTRTIVRGWPAWVLAAAVPGLVAGVSLAVAGGSDVNSAASTAAGFLILVALPAAGVAVLALLYRMYQRHRARRLAALPPGLRGNGPGDWRQQDPAG